MGRLSVKDESKWAEAEKVARRVVESGKHRLISDYETVWKNTCNGIWDAGESLIEVSFYSPTGLDSDNTAGRIGKWNGVSGHHDRRRARTQCRQLEGRLYVHP